MLNILRKLTLPNKEDGVNLLNKIVYGQFSMNNLVVWYDDSKRDLFINQGYKGNATVYSIVRKIADKEKELPIPLIFKGQNSKYRNLKFSGKSLETASSRIVKREMVEVTKSPLTDLLANPNPMQNWTEFMDNVSVFYRSTGEAFIYGVKIGVGRDAEQYSELYVLPSQNVVLVQGDMFEPVKGYKLNIGDQSIEIPAEDVLHLKTTNPTWDLQGSQLRGMPPLLAGIKYLQKNNEAIKALQKAMQSEGAKGFVSPDTNNEKLWANGFNPETLAGLKEGLDKAINGSVNKNKVGAVGIPVKYTEIGLSPVALDILKGMEYDDEKLCSLWGINISLFRSDSKYDNMEQAKKSLVTDVVIPFLNMFEQKLNGWLSPKYDNVYIDFDTTVFSELQPDVKIILDTYGKWHGTTPNEVRELLNWARSEDEGMDKHWIPQNLIPMEDAIIGNLNGDFSDLT